MAISLLYIGIAILEKGKGFLFEKKHKKQFFMFALIIGISNLFSLTAGIFHQGNEEDIILKKNGYGGSIKEYQLFLKDDMDEINTEYTLEVSPQYLKEDILEEQIKEAFQIIGNTMLGKNSSYEQISENLVFHAYIDGFPFDIAYQPYSFELIDNKGRIRNENLKEAEETQISVTISYEEEEYQKVFDLIIVPKRFNEAELKKKKVIEQIKKLEEQEKYKTHLVLPRYIDDINISLKNEKNHMQTGIFILGIITAILIVVRDMENKRTKEKERLHALELLYPAFINKLVLLLGAGMSMKNILCKLVWDVQKREEKQTVLYQELLITMHELESGVEEEKAYYHLGRRLKLPCYLKLITLIEQNLKKGSKGLTNLLEQEVLAAFGERKEMAKRLGEEAGTKLLMPMMLLMITVIIMIMIPAFMSFQI